MVMKQWTSDDGLRSNNLTAVYQSSDGFLWVSSFNGLHRFDGRGFENFYKENVSVFKTNSIYGVTELRPGELLIASQAGGVLRYAKGGITKMEEFPVASVRKLLVDSKKRIWCGTNGEGLFYKEGNRVVELESEFLERARILDLYEDRHGTIWIGSEGKGLISFDKNGKIESFNNTDNPSLSSVTKIIESKDGKLILGTSNGVYEKNGDQFLIMPNTGNLYINDLSWDPNGYYWVASEHGVARVNIATRTIDLFDETNGLPANQVSSVIVDEEGSIWLSTKKAGLIQLAAGSIFTLDESDGLVNTRVNIVVEHSDRMYVGSDDGSISVLGGDKPYVIENSAWKRGTGIRDIAVTDDGVMWLASYDGLHRIENGKERLLTMEEGLPSNFIRRILKRRDGSLWLATRSGGVVKMIGDRVAKVYDITDGLNVNYILALEDDGKGNVIAGTHSGGLTVISKNGISNYAPIDFSGLLIFNVHVDEEFPERWWLCTNAGIYLFENEEFKLLSLRSELASETYFDLVQDNNGNAWTTTNVGVIRMSKKQLDEFAEGKISSVDGELFDNSDGMVNRECTGATRSIFSKDGMVWVPTLDGIATIDPQNLKRNLSIPKVSVTHFMVDGELMVDDVVQVAPGKLRYEIGYTASSYVAPEKVQFRYRLSGVDKDWITTHSSEIEYTNLKPGDYTFQVIASNNDNIWNEEGAKLMFVVRPYIHQTWWFRMLLVLAILFAGYFLFVWRVRHVWAVNKELRKLNEELDRFVYSVSHDLRAPLTSILGLTHIAKDSSTKEESDMCVDMIERSAVKLDSFISDIIDYSRNQRMEIVEEAIDVKEELESILESVRYLDEKGKVECKVDSSVDTLKIDVRRLRVILKNIIANAIIYRDAQKEKPYVHVSCWQDTSSYIISVADNGLGIKPSAVNNIFKMFFRAHTDSKGSGLGLYIAKENANKLNAKLTVASKLGVGTSFTLILPKV
jgi:ligand-binding sensor domain-containing protein/signal transduction histidine kinase